MARLHPGVYVEEIPSGVRPIEGVSTSTAAFIGKAEMGTLKKAVLVTSLEEFQRKYGKFLNDSFLAQAVLQFYNNGGKVCYIVRVAGAGAVAADISIKDRKAAPAKTVTVKAANEGEWGNKLDVEISDSLADPGNLFSMRVLRDRSDQVPPLPPLALESFEDLSMNPDADNHVEKVITANSQYIRVEVDPANALTAARGTSRSGRLPVGNGAGVLKLSAAGGAAATDGVDGPPATPGRLRSGAAPEVNPAADQRRFLIELNDDGAKSVTLSAQTSGGPAIAAEIQTAVRALAATNPAKQPAYANFTAVYDTTGGAGNEMYVLTSGTAGADPTLPAGSSKVRVTNAPAVTLLGAQNRFTIFIDGDGPHTVTLAAPLNTGLQVAGAILNAVTNLVPKRTSNLLAFQQFTCTYENDNSHPNNPSLLLTSGTPALAGNPAGTARLRSSVRVTDAPNPTENAAGLLKLGVTNSGIETVGSASLRPANSQVPTEYHLGDAVFAGNVAGVTFGADGLLPAFAQYSGGLRALDPINDVNIVCIPGIGDLDVVAEGVNYCTQRADCFYIADTNKSDDSRDEAITFMNSVPGKSSYAALYFPWLKMPDPSGVSAAPIAAPPSGFVAGMYARIDARRGVWKAPAGTEANVGGAVGLVADLSDADQDFLNPIGVNLIRSFPASGIVIWGARTLATRSNPEYRYVPVRRTAIFLERSIYNGIQYAVFEPNDEDLWASLRLNIGAFMLLQFRAGAFQGRTPADAFFVKVDNQTTTQADIDAGIVNILVGFAPLKPAEFVVLKLSQKVNQPAA